MLEKVYRMTKICVEVEAMEENQDEGKIKIVLGSSKSRTQQYIRQSYRNES